MSMLTHRQPPDKAWIPVDNICEADTTFSLIFPHAARIRTYNLTKVKWKCRVQWWYYCHAKFQPSPWNTCVKHRIHFGAWSYLHNHDTTENLQIGEESPPPLFKVPRSGVEVWQWRLLPCKVISLTASYTESRREPTIKCPSRTAYEHSSFT